MSTSILAPTINPHKGTTITSAWAFALDDVIQATIVNPAGGVLTPCQASLELSADGGATFQPIDSERGSTGDSLTMLLVFELSDYASIAVWTHARLVFTGNTAQSQLGVTVSAIGDGGTWGGGGGGGGGLGTVTTVSVVTANGVSGTVTNPTTTPAITLSLGAITPTSVTTTTITGLNSPTNASDAVNKTYVDTIVAGKGTVTSVSIVNANGVSGAVTNPTTTPALTLVLGAITPTSVTTTTVTGLNAPTTPTDAATKAYVDAISAGLTFITPGARVATTGALTATYSNGASGVGATLTNSGTQAAIAIDGVTLSASDVVLVKNQAAPAQNGIYTVTAIGSGASNWVLTRQANYDSTAEVVAGSYTAVGQGTSNAATLWIMTGATPITVGTTSVTFSPLNITGSGSVTMVGSGTGLTGGPITTTGTLSIANSGVGTLQLADASVTPAKLAGIAALTLLGNPTISAGASVTGVTLGSGLAFSGTTLTATGTGGTVTTVSVVSANGVSGTVTNPTTTPAITLTLGAITPTTIVASGAISGSNLSGTNTGDQTITLTGQVTGSGTGSFATTIQTSVALAGSPTTTTQAPGDSSTKIATTAFVTAAVTTASTITLTGDVTGSGAGSLSTTIGTGKVTYPKLQNESVFTLLGNPTGTPAHPDEITLGNGLQFVAGTLSVANTIGVGSVTNIATGTGLTGGPITSTGTISLATIPTLNLLANTAGGAAAPAGVSLSSLMDPALGSVQGDVIYRGASAWSALAPGTAGQVLRTAGASANPAWAETGLTITQHKRALIVPSGTSGTITMDLSLGDYQAPAALTGATTLALSNPVVGQIFVVDLIPGGNAVIWFGTLKWAGGSAPILTATAGKHDVFIFTCISSGVFLGFIVGQNC